MPVATIFNSIFYKYSLTLFLLLFSPFTRTLSQSRIKEEYQYLSPLPGAKLVQPESKIIIRQGNTIDISTLDSSFIVVHGQNSGIHRGNIILSDDMKTIIFDPIAIFTLGETVEVSIKKGIKTIDGRFLDPVKYHFRITKMKVRWEKRRFMLNFLSNMQTKNNQRKIPAAIGNNSIRVITGIDSLPRGFPTINLLTNNHPTNGVVFSAPFQTNSNPYTGFLLITDNYAIPIFYRQLDFAAIDFKEQNNGFLTYFDYKVFKFYELDSSYTKIDSFYCGNGYQTDPHELQLLPNGHALLIGDDFEEVDMDTVIQGGDSSAVVMGNIIQELDQNKNVVFQWRTWDHYQITDATPDIDLTDSLIDYVHCNAIEEDTDGNILISCRHLDEVTKINRQTGDIIWRWGGEYCKNNQFTFVNDPEGFSHQHDIRRIANGDLTLFDDGNLHNPPHTRVCEYQMDELQKTATLVWEYQNNPITFSLAMGNIERLSDGNSFIGWGYNFEAPGISEVTSSGTIEWAASFLSSTYNYRTFRFNWRTNYFTVNPDSISFVNIHVGSSDSSAITLTNNSGSPLLINDIYSSDSVFTISQLIPFTVPPHGIKNLTVRFTPNSENPPSGWIHLRSERTSEMIAQTIFVQGIQDSTLNSNQRRIEVKKFKLYQNYPNPFNPATTISYSIPFEGNVSLKVFDILGREIEKLVDKQEQKGNYKVRLNASTLSSGVYFYRIEVHGIGGDQFQFTDVKKFLLVK